METIPSSNSSLLQPYWGFVMTSLLWLKKPSNKYKSETYQPFNKHILFVLAHSGNAMSVFLVGKISSGCNQWEKLVGC